MLITIIAPFYNEELVVAEFYRRMTEVVRSLKKINFELIVINDGSTDNTLSVLKDISHKDNRVKIINFSKNFGHQAAILAGIRNASGDAAVIIDGDLQDPPELIPKMLEKWEKGSDVVYAKRLKRKGETFFKTFTAFMYYRLINFLSDTKIPKDVGDFRLIDRKVVNALHEINESNLFIRGIISWVGFKQSSVEYERDKRFAGKTKYPFFKMMNFAIDGITSFSIKPLRFSLKIGLFSIAIGIGLIIFAVVNKYVHPEIVIRGWPSLLITIIFFGGVQLFTIGLLGEYIGKIYKETKKRPVYVIKEKIGFEDNKDNKSG